jgi:hypothetical protein
MKIEEIKNSRFVQNLKRQAEENPVVVLAVTATLVSASAKLVSANTARSNSKVWAKEVARRDRLSRIR